MFADLTKSCPESPGIHLATSRQWPRPRLHCPPGIILTAEPGEHAGHRAALHPGVAEEL